MLSRLFDASSKQSLSLMVPPGDMKRPGSSLQESVESLRQRLDHIFKIVMNNFIVDNYCDNYFCLTFLLLFFSTSIYSPLVTDAVKNYSPLDLPRLKHDLIIVPNENKIMLLKAIRWVGRSLLSLITFMLFGLF